jgi:hypothetical protein
MLTVLRSGEVVELIVGGGRAALVLGVALRGTARPQPCTRGGVPHGAVMMNSGVSQSGSGVERHP